MSSDQQPPTGLPVGALAVGTWWRTAGTNCAAPPAPLHSTHRVGPTSTPTQKRRFRFPNPHSLDARHWMRARTACFAPRVRDGRLPSTVLPTRARGPREGPDQKKRAAERSMLFLRCQPRVPSASAPPFRPRVRVAAPLGVRVTGGRRGQAVVAMASADARLAGIASSIRVIPDFPKPGGFTPDFRTIVPHLTSLSVSTTLLLYGSRGWTTGRWMSGRE